jgi:hypothetical protein
MYENFYINFLSSVPRPILEDLASVAIEAKAQECVIQVHDQYMNFLSLEPNLFSLHHEHSYANLNGPDDTYVEETVNKMVHGLFSVLVTLGCVPIIRCPRGNAAEMVAQKLDSKLRDHLMNTRENLFQQDPSSSLSLRRPGR